MFLSMLFFLVVVLGKALLGLLFLYAARNLLAPFQRLAKRRGCQERIIIFSRYPTPGTTKTRLIPSVGDKGAARCQRVMTEALLARLLKKELEHRCLDVWFSGGSVSLMRNWLRRRFPDTEYTTQPQDKDLGVRIASAFFDAFQSGMERVIVVGADIPGVGMAEVDAAFSSLRSSDVDMVLGPAADGGYYLVGLNTKALSKLSTLFTGHNIAWGTGSAREGTLAAAKAEGLRAKVLSAELNDVDEAEDLPEVERRLGISAEALRSPKLSVVIPTLNEAQNIEATISSAVLGVSDVDIEVVVADGGSTDGSLKLLAELPKRKWWPKKAKLRVVATPRGRGTQLKRGVDAASGDLLLMLHADSVLPPRFDEYLRTALDEPGVSMGAFAFDLDSLSGPAAASATSILRAKLKLLRWGTNIRAKFLELPYDDQALFMTRRSLEEAGGVPEWPLLEDVELVCRLKKLGRIQIVDAPVVTSARRWREKGYIRTTGGNQIILIAYALGVSPTTLADWYYGKSKAE